MAIAEMMLSEKAFEGAGTFIRTFARPLEQALFAFHFEQGSRDAVLDTLAAFQHENGGFGYALEPDIRLPDASPMASSVAFQIMRDIQTLVDHPMVVKGIAYLLKAYHPYLERWTSLPPAVNNHPHAPWWTYDPEREQAPGFRANVSAEIIGHLWHYRKHVPEGFLNTVTEKALTHLATLPVEMEMHDVLCYHWLFDASHLPDAERGVVGEKLLQAGPAIVTRDADQWAGYAVRPLWLAPRPDALLADVLAEEVQCNLDYEIEHQGDEGAWAPFWSWGGDAWADAQCEWKGVLTMKTLLSLKAFGRV